MTTTLITGASGGIGEEFARQLAAGGHDLILVARSKDKLDALADELRSENIGAVRVIACDLQKPDAPGQIFAETERLDLKVDWLINNAGFGSYGDFAQLPIEREVGMIDLNIRALVELTRLYLPGMRERSSGQIINVSSAAAFQPIPFMATYAATKAFVNSFSEAIAEENRPYGVNVLALCPGSTKTNFFAAANMDKPIQVKGQQTVEEVVETALKAVKAGRTRVVSGFVNDAVARVVNFVPNRFITHVLARATRERYQK